MKTKNMIRQAVLVTTLERLSGLAASKTVRPQITKMFVLCFALLLVSEATAATRGFTPTGNMSTPRYAHSATLLPNGKVLVAGGWVGPSSIGAFNVTRSAELYDASTGLFTTMGDLSVGRAEHTATLLPHGRVLITGGDFSTSIFVSSAELFEPTAGTSAATGAMNFSRVNGHTATLLPDGRVLVVGGQSHFNELLASAELYDPATGVFTFAGNLTTPRQYHTATLLADGRVLIAGGFSSVGVVASSAELYDPITGTFSPTGAMRQGHVWHTASLLANGHVLIAGGMLPGFSVGSVAELYDPATGTFSFTGSLNSPRMNHAATLLPDENVLLTGGGSAPDTTAEVYDFAARRFLPLSTSMNTARANHTATLMSDGAVLIAGGYNIAHATFCNCNTALSLANAELLPPNSPPMANAGPDQTVIADSSCHASVTLDATGSSDPDGDPLTYTWEGDFGTATGSVVTVLLTTGAHDVTLHVSDGLGGTASASVMLTVAANSPNITCPAPITQPNDPGVCGAVVTYTAPVGTDNCPGVTTVQTAGLPSGATFPIGTTVNTFEVTDASGNKTACSFNVTVLNPNPVVTLTGPASGSLYAVNTPVNFTATFTDAGGGTHTGTWMIDSILQAATLVEPSGATPGLATATYTFTAAGVYTVKLTINDSCGGSGTADQTGGMNLLVVVYDPSAGFVTGGGWINSPAGAYVADPTLTGKANFGFVSKYQKGANVPTGNTEFQFQAASFNFHSTAYEWLVVSGAKAQHKGSGTINGAGNYGFLLTATDGQVNGGGGVDKFRIKIWDKVTSAIVYDNVTGTSDDINTGNPQAIAGGSIVIHK